MKKLNSPRRAVAPRLLLMLLALALLAFGGCASQGPPIYQWQVESPTATVTMAGSIHVGQPDFFPLPDPFEDAFRNADALAVEVDAVSPENVAKVQTMMMQQGMLPGDETLKDRLDPELYARLEAFAAEKGEPLAMYSKFKPGLVALILTMNEYQRQGFDMELGIDKHFLDQAREMDKPVRELETLEDQLKLFLEVDDELDDDLIAATLDQVDQLQEQTARMVALWKAGDVEGLDAFLQEQIGDDPEITAYYRKLLDDRNVGMADQIDAWLRGDEDVYVVVGAGHFAGDMGIVSLLEEKGWKVEQAHSPKK